MKWRRRGKAGLTLVELLVVLGVIAIISAVAIPTLARSGWFTSNKSALGARELFTVLRAAKVYATTYNVDTAVAYGMRLVTDSQTGASVPVADSVVLARGLTRDEIKSLRLGGVNISGDDPVFVPLRGREGVFRVLPNQTCVLPDLFKAFESESPFGPDFVSDTGLSDIQLLDLSTDMPTSVEPRTVTTAVDPDGSLDYQLGSLANSFPAHRFTSDGSLATPDGQPKQRFTVRIGMLPDQDPSDRFYVNPNDVEIRRKDDWILAIHHDGTPGNPVQVPWPVNANNNQPVDIATPLILFRPTGRVKIAS